MFWKGIGEESLGFIHDKNEFRAGKSVIEKDRSDTPGKMFVKTEVLHTQKK